ncbi:hypothetical protein KMC60_gp46 [Achromobacter phage vB_AxyP_19-32_Axy11]|uniref:Tail length tape-measure protein n=3 Tax=Pourcelvirus TaxID=2842976 RepID=A0A514CVZ6_9CAUD|nr:hypothetical protein KMC59_gp48 [Achromobacter phage vB_AxyP_19-32_Axy10]YP_010079440.1 hypothetical protein KMC60_gp46 [Achromobacter phage vB_AxyP_19-32_Axy11]QDH83965.1 hypothetical protein Axy10_070 [Achromobacter phage vB_AxyP_19-32_Axy10]QDH84045.1 hypothetical protein Axy11_069 [Achromobacter phage vB_AxyP_19-32_Axy11]QDH84641.1 hypothetical protein Axy22_066 [Achromobacter phage vB_AxyP_19-32_Axy22]
MSNESAEVQIARVEERLKTIFEMLEREGNSKRDIYKELQALSQGMLLLNGRVGNVESSLAKSAPTIEEFITIKHKVVGAGLMGKWIWAVAGGLLSAIIFAKKELFSWFTGG